MRAFDVLPDGSLANGRIFAELKDGEKRGSPDGLKVDRAGNVYSSGVGGVWVFSPKGVLLGKIAVPEGTTNVAWGDSEGKTLYITANTSVYRIKTLIGG
jgi:gluconolactonase